MIEQDTVKLLRECDAGIKMGVSSIDDVLPYVSDNHFKQVLSLSKDAHSSLQKEVESLLENYHDDGKSPNPVAKGMSEMKTGVMMAVNRSDKTIADLMTDGCNMGVKSLHRYLNQYEAADEKSKDIAKRLSHVEESLAQDIRVYL